MQQRKSLDLGVHLPDPDPGISISLISLSLLFNKKHIWFTYLNFMSLLLSFEFKYKYLFSILYVELLFTIWVSDSQSNLLVWSSRSRNLKLCRVLTNIFIRNLKQLIMILYIKSLFCSINFTFSTYVVIDKLKI